MQKMKCCEYAPRSLVLHLQARQEPIQRILSQAWVKKIAGTNTPAYFALAAVTKKKKCFKTLIGEALATVLEKMVLLIQEWREILGLC
jgi:hypothetical protein